MTQVRDTLISTLCKQYTHYFTEAICEGFQNLQELWAVPVELGIALWLLERELSLAFLAPTAVAAISVMGIAWTANGPPAVSNLNFNIQPHQLLFIIGPVGSGKSTLLKGLLGETPSTQGFVYSTSPETAFVDQSPWVRNGTIQENILGISAFQESWYKKVIHCCGLQSDISSMPKGHGQSGFSLSSEKYTDRNQQH